MQITSGNAVLTAESHGSGSPDVLMVHAGVTDQRSWRHVVDRLPASRCLTYDTRGYGRTTYEHEDGWSYVADAVAVLDAYDAPRAVVVGCSNGGRTALDLTLAHPERVSALLLIAPSISGAPQPEFGPEFEQLESMYDAAEEAGDHAEVNRLEAWIWLDGPLVPEGRVQGPPRDLFLAMNGIALEAADPGEVGAVDAAWPQLGDIDVPTLVLVGEHDFDYIHGRCRHLAETIPQARLVTLPGVAHLPHLEGDEKTLSEIAAFVGSVGAAI